MRIAGKNAIGGDAIYGGNVGLILDGARLEKRFPVVFAGGGPGRLYGKKFGAFFTGFTVELRKPEVVTDGCGYVKVVYFE